MVSKTADLCILPFSNSQTNFKYERGNLVLQKGVTIRKKEKKRKAGTIRRKLVFKKRFVY